MKNVKDFFNEFSATWSEDAFIERKQYKIIEKFYECYSKVKNHKPKILDIGCGVGYDAKILSECGAVVTGIDFCEMPLSVAKTKVQNVSFCEKDITTDNLSELGRFDGAVCLETLDYIDIKDMNKTIKNIAGCLKSGALLLISVLNGSSKNIERSFQNIKGQDYDKNFNCYDAEQLCTFAFPELKLVDTWQFNDFSDGWRYYIFIKQPIK